MNPEVSTWIQLVLRWAHVVAGVLWIGLLYFFNFVNGPFAKTLDANSKKAVVPELMPRALYWFRWGAAWTWITGFLLVGLVYYMGGVLFEDPTSGNMMIGWVMLLVALIFPFFYDVVQKQMSGLAANAVSVVLLAVLYGLLSYVGHFSGRALYIFIGVAFGTAMAMNVWMRIWPSQRKIITAVKEGNAPDAAIVALAGLRSRHNTFMSVPLLFFMISNHYPTIYGSPLRDVYAAVVIALGWWVASMLYKKSASVPGF